MYIVGSIVHQSCGRPERDAISADVSVKSYAPRLSAMCSGENVRGFVTMPCEGGG